MVGQTQSGTTEDVTADVQAYLITRYREALKSGDKSYAKSCLLSTRLFSVNDPNITNEIYLMAKSDGDVNEAAKCFANIFNDVLQDDQSSKDDASSETLLVINQIKDEIRLLLNELKLQFLKLRSSTIISAPNASGLQSRQASIAQSPILSPRLRLSSEDCAASKDPVFTLNNHLHSTRKSFFYQQLFDSLPKEIRKDLLFHSIENSENPFERCRLMMLTLSIFEDTVVILGPRLIRTLADLSHQVSEKNNHQDKLLSAPRPPVMSNLAKSMLVLDAIPLVISLEKSEKLEIQLDELLMKTLCFYSEYCLENVATDYELSELHEGLKKTIAARILGKEMSGAPEDPNAECLMNSSNLLMEKFLNEISCDEQQKEKLRQLRQIVLDRTNRYAVPLSSVMNIINSLELEEDIPDLILFQSSSQNSSSIASSVTNTTPPKGRGRPKKVQPSVIVSVDDGTKRHMRTKALESQFVFFTLVQILFLNSFHYLRQTKSRVLIDFNNPLAMVIESELSSGSKPSSQRISRSKNPSQEAPNPSKKIKIEACSDERVLTYDLNAQYRIPKDSPLNSETSRKLDQEIVDCLRDIHKCIQYLSGGSETMIRLWSNNFVPNISTANWYKRVYIDSMLLAGQYDLAVKRLVAITKDENDEPQIKGDPNDGETSTLTVTTCSSTSAKQLRAAAQLISCYIQIVDRVELYAAIDDVLTKLRISGLLNREAGYSTGNIIEEYMILLDDQTGLDSPSKHLGFLFFDTLSLIRYVVDTMMDILKRYTSRFSTMSDVVVGHCIVLSQLDWPKEAALYERCVAWIRANKPKSTTPQCLSPSTKFTYPEFFQYITDPNIIEDFASLLNEGYTLDISGSSGIGSSSISRSTSAGYGAGATSVGATGSERTPTRGSKTMTTRGVNRNFKDQLRFMLIDQMRLSSTIVPLSLITGFLQTSLIPYLTSLGTSN